MEYANVTTFGNQSNGKQPVPIISPSAFTGELPTGDAPLKNVFLPDWFNKPDPLPGVISLAGTTILTHQNSAAIIAKPGAGKSSIIEAIAASYLNDTADNLGFEVDPFCKGVIVIDNERTNYDVWSSFYRMCKRAGISQGAEVSNVTIAGLRSVARLDERIATIEHLLKNHPCSLLLIDGAGDLVTDTNDLQQAIECRIWLREITVKYNIAILVTLHPNPNGDKPRGHQGSEICREAESVLLAKSYDEYTRIITTDFEHGKNRNNPKLTSAYGWSDEKKMFVTADLDNVNDLNPKKKAAENYKKQGVQQLAMVVLAPPKSLRNVELIAAIMDYTKQSEPTANRKINEMLKYDFVTKDAAGIYRINLDSI